MESSDPPEEGFTVAPSEVRAQLERILRSRSFQRSERLKRFLKFTVECVLDGTSDQIKESLLGRTIFDRGSEYDPRIDSIVRVESQRLRTRLRKYYESEGQSDPVSIIFLPGSYVPAFAYPKQSWASQSDQKWSPWPSRHFLNPRTIAVLPLANLSADPEQEYFCEGITDDLIYALSCLPGLNVIGHTSVFALKGVAQDVREIGARLAAGIIVDGTVRKSGDRLRIFAEMIDAASGEVRWAETFDRTEDGVFAVEEEIAKSVARALQTILVPIDIKDLIRGAPDMDAYRLYLQGRHEWNRMSAEGYRAAAEIFQSAIAFYPNYASPYAGLADAYLYLALWGYARPSEVLPKAHDSAAQALKLDSSLPHANSALAATTALYSWRWAEGAEFARRAIQVEPSYAFGQQIYGCCLLALGELEHAEARMGRGVVLDPLSVRANRLLGWTLYLRRQPSEAEKWLQAAMVVDREPAQTRYLLARVYLSQGRLEEALDQALQCQVDPPDALSLGLLGACLARLGRREEAFDVAATLARLSDAGYIDPHAIAQVQIALNNLDPAMASVQKILDERSPFAFFLKFDPEFDPLRHDARFGALISRLG